MLGQRPPRLADARPLVFRPMRSTRSDPSSVSVAISLVLPIFCSSYLHNLSQRNSMRLFPDLTNQIGRGHLRQRARSCTGLEKEPSQNPANSRPLKDHSATPGTDQRIDLSTVLARTKDQRVSHSAY
jgi:hypothetical protein